MDPLLAAKRFPKLAERAMRTAVVGAIARKRITPRALVNDALVRFEQSAQRETGGGARSALLFAQRAQIVGELRRFIDGQLAVRLLALPRRNVVAIGLSATPFDAIVRGKNGDLFAVALRRLPSDGRRLEWLRRINQAARSYRTCRLSGVLLYDFGSGRMQRLNCNAIDISKAA